MTFKKLLIDSIKADLKALVDPDNPPQPTNGSYSGLLSLARHQLYAERRTVRYRPSRWLGRSLTTSDKRQLKEAIEVLEAKGKIATHRDRSGRVQWIGLTG